MFSFLKPKKKPIYLVDGDCCSTQTWLLWQVVDIAEVYVVVNVDDAVNTNSKLKPLRNNGLINEVKVGMFRAGKETVDKTIGMMAQKAICDGYTEINLVSLDYDFIEMARILGGLNHESVNDTVRINVIMPHQNKSCKVNTQPSQHGKISVNVYRVREKKSVDVDIGLM